LSRCRRVLFLEGSGTYLVPYLRDFCGHVKTLDPNLLTTGAIKPGRASDGGLLVTVPARGYICWEFKEN
jgi:hypothetical protein